MTTQEKVLNLVRKEGTVTVDRVTEKLGNLKVAQRTLYQLKKKGCLDAEKNGRKYTYFLPKTKAKTSETTSETKSENKNIGNELQNILLETIAKYSSEKVLEQIMPELKKKCIEEFGMIPVKHEIKVGNSDPVTIKGDLPPCFDSILAYAVAGNPVMMTGPAGTGKGYLARQVALATGAKFFEVNAVKNSYDLTGFVDAQSRFVKTPFYDACKTVAEGGKAVFLFDEMDCSEPEVLKIFNEALASFEFNFPNDEHLTFDNLIILCACNTFGTGADEAYCGQQLDASTLDRFVMVKVDYDKNIEMQIAQGDSELVNFIDEFRAQTVKKGFVFVASYRSLKRIAAMRGILPLKQVMKECFLKSIAADDLEYILDGVQNEGFDNNPYYKACRGFDVEWNQISKKAA